MSFLSAIHRLLGGPTDSERVEVRRGWREAVHANRNEVTKANGAARRLRKSSIAATEALEVDKAASATLLARLRRNGDILIDLSTEALDPTRK